MSTYILTKNGAPTAVTTTSPWNGTPTMSVIEDKNGNVIDYDGVIECRHDIKSFAEAEQYAAFAAAYTAETWLPVDNGNGFTITAAPKIGTDVSKAFNGDYYYVGKIVKITPAWTVIAEDADGVQTRFRRKGKSSRWMQEGGTWSLVAGIHNVRNPHL